MRIIAGTARSLPLKTVPGDETRPTTDRIKETLFNIIRFDLPGCSFLDLFAGSGGIGLEALSRGAKNCVFVEKSKKACDCIRDNITFTRFTEKSRVIHKDCLNALAAMDTDQTFDVVFMDPPYGKGLENDVLSFLADSPLITANTLLIIETSHDTDLNSYLCDGAFTIIKEKRYKTNRHVFLRRKL